MRTKKLAPIALLLVLLLTGLACNFPTANQNSPTGPEATFTALAQTLDVLLTQTAVAGGQTTATLQASQTPAPATATRFPSSTSVPPTAVPCDAAAFLQDVTYPDGTQVKTGQAFTKTWRLQNTGSCTWSTSYELVFDSGTAMNAPSSVNLPGSVGPGETIDLSVSLTAPTAPGTYRGNFKLRDANGTTFGIGVNNNIAFWVEVKVISTTTTPTITTTATRTATPTTSPGATTVYDFVGNYCSAEWVSGFGALTCHGTVNDPNGFVIRLDNPKLQNGQSAGQLALETAPQHVANGAISGRYPAISVASGYRFNARISCLNGASACNVQYQLNYHSDGGAIQELGHWDLKYTNGVQTLDVDLSSLAGHSVEFVLGVVSNNTTPTDQDLPLWVAPKIVH